MLVELTRGGELLAAHEVEAVESVPALFTLDASGQGAAVARNDDGRLNTPQSPAKRGSIVELYATGFGQITPMPPDGSTIPLEPPWPELVHRFSAWIQAPVETGAVGMEVLYAGPAPGLIAGVIQINVRIPEDASAGDAVIVQLAMDNYERTQRDCTLALAP